jgi:pSer/pThr/pTyr-binding forkhead associated (FHA) protein
MALLVLVHEGLTLKRIPLEKPEIYIGRRPDADIYVDDKLASQQHAKIEAKQNPKQKGVVEYFIEDMDSTNHTFVNNEAITSKKLVHDDLIRIGKHVFKFVDEKEALGDKTTKLHKSWIPGVYYTKE